MSLTRRSLLAAGALAGGCAALPRRPLRVLYLNQAIGWRHETAATADGSPSLSQRTLDALAAETAAFTVSHSGDAREITPERLRNVDVLMFYTTGELPIGDEAWDGVLDWLARGGGFIGVHSAADTGWRYGGEGPDYTRLLGGRFRSHPWTEGTLVRIDTYALHATTAMWPGSFDYREEIYQYKDYDPAAVRVVQALDMAGTALKRPYLVPVSWLRTHGRGRLFYTNLGHSPATWADPRFRRQLVDTIRWSAGHGPADAEPNPLDQARWSVGAFLAYAGDPFGAPGASTTDPNWLLDVGRRIAALPDTPTSAAVDALRAEIRARLATELWPDDGSGI